MFFHESDNCFSINKRFNVDIYQLTIFKSSHFYKICVNMRNISLVVSFKRMNKDITNTSNYWLPHFDHDTHVTLA
jgi:hypothetical protein